MTRRFAFFPIVATALALAAPSFSGTKTVVDIAVGSPDHTTLVAAVKAAGLVETLSGPGPFTVFAPANSAFGKLPAGAVDDLLKPENKDKLAAVLTYHVVAGNVSAAELKKMIKDGKGKASVKTVQGETLTAMVKGGKVVLQDAKGGSATVTAADLAGTNGVVHVIDTVVMP